MLSPVQALRQTFIFPPTLMDAEGLPDDAVVQAPSQAPAQAAAPVVHTGPQHRQGFLVGGLGLMIQYADGSELTEIPRLFYLPNTPEWFLGMTNLHGNMLPVLDLKRFLKMPPGQADSREKTPMLLVLAHGADAAGIVIDDMPERIQWTADDQTGVETAPSALQPYIQSACVVDDRLWFDLKITPLLDSIEQSIQSYS